MLGAAAVTSPLKRKVLPMDAKREVALHVLATLAYRTQKAAAGAPAGFADFDAGEGTRSPREVVRHMADLLRFARSMFRPTEPLDDGTPGRHEWSVAVDEFRVALTALALEIPASDLLAKRDGRPMTLEQLVQGPLSDALTHAGQLAFLRRLAGSPIPGEDFTRADVHRTLHEWTQDATHAGELA
ncbi:MAG: hypothetical protein JWM27_4214 [Gemmatimonadetes bacterium]|nr:hypothetical protein [Gemmatimonadota bacterium]